MWLFCYTLNERIGDGYGNAFLQDRASEIQLRYKEKNFWGKSLLQ
jgi:hypothetical protein